MFKLCFQRVPRYSIVIYFQSIFHGFQMGILSILYLIFSVFSIISMEFFKVAHRNCSDVHVFQYWRAWVRTWRGHSRDCHSMVELLGGIQDFLWPFPVLLGGSKLLNLLGWPLGGLKESCAECLPWCLAGCTWSAILHLADRSVRHLCLLHPHCFCSARFSKISAVCEHSLNIAWT